MIVEWSDNRTTRRSSSGQPKQATRRSSSGRPKQATRRSSSGPTIEPLDDRRVVRPVRPSNHSTIVEWSVLKRRSNPKLSGRHQFMHSRQNLDTTSYELRLYCPLLHPKWSCRRDIMIKTAVTYSKIVINAISPKKAQRGLKWD